MSDGARESVRLCFKTAAIWVMAICIRLLRPLVIVRFVGIDTGRIGHLVGNTQLAIYESEHFRKRFVRPVVTFFMLHEDHVANQYALKLFNRRMTILSQEFHRIFKRINASLPGGYAHQNEATSQHDRDIHNFYARNRPSIRIPEQDERRGWAALQALGVDRGAKYVTLLVRDDAYLKQRYPHRDWSYHGYRDASLEKYLQAVDELTGRGYYVIRMGSVVATGIETENKKIIDYSTSNHQNDFNDVFLMSRCDFCISTSSGLDAVAEVFRRPVLFCDFVPVAYVRSYMHGSLFILKHLYEKESGRVLKFSELLASGCDAFTTSGEYDTRGLGVKENTEQEIRSAIEEMRLRVESRWPQSEEDDQMQAAFWNLFPDDSLSDVNGERLHGEVFARCASSFLREHEHWRS